MKFKLSPDLEQRLRELDADPNRTDKEIAQLLGLSRNTLASYKKKLGIPVKPKRGCVSKPLSEEQNNQLQELYSKGLNDYEVAEIMKLGRARLREWRQYHNIASHTNKKGLNITSLEKAEQMIDEGHTTTQIGEELGVYRTSIAKLLKKHNKSLPPKHFPVRKDLKDYILTPRQKEILLGEMFGDGNLAPTSKESAYYQGAHCFEQEQFLLWKAKEFSPLTVRVYYTKSAVCTATQTNTELGQWYNRFYPTHIGNKILTADMIPEMTPLSLAVWFMGDGSINGKTAVFHVGLQINLDPIAETATKHFGLWFKACPYEHEWHLRVMEPEKFFPLIATHLLPIFNYKIPEQYQYLIPSPQENIIHFKDIYENPSFTKEIFRKLPIDQRETIVTEALNFYWGEPFPYPVYSENILNREFDRMLSSQTLRTEDRILVSQYQGSTICDHFFPHRYDAARSSFKPMDTWHNKSKLRKFLQSRLWNFSGKFIDKTIRTGMHALSLPMNFNPMAAKYIYSHYTPIDGKVLDFSAGYGGRLLGCALSNKNLQYVGVEPYTKSYQSLLQLTKFIKTKQQGFNPTLHNSPFEDLTFEPEMVDLVFSSPPYFKLELYCDEPTQSIVRYPEYKDWLEKFWLITLKKSIQALKPNGYLIFSLSNFDKYDIIKDTLTYLSQYKLEGKDNLYFKYKNMFRQTDKLEIIFIFQKK